MALTKLESSGLKSPHFALITLNVRVGHGLKRRHCSKFDIYEPCECDGSSLYHALYHVQSVTSVY